MIKLSKFIQISNTNCLKVYKEASVFASPEFQRPMKTRLKMKLAKIMQSDLRDEKRIKKRRMTAERT